jgi:hypothetical protein
VVFTVGVSGTSPFTYQWLKGSAALAGGTSATLTLTNVQSADAGNYSCTITNSAGSVTSSAATLTVTAALVAPTIAVQPVSAAVSVGAAASFSVVANGSSPLSYQWYKGSTVLSGATSATYSLASVQSADAGSYTCTVTNTVGSVTSSAAVLTVSTVAVAPAITVQPASTSAKAGDLVAFTVQATGTAPLTYQWYFGVSAISGATDATYTLGAAQTSNAGSYACVVSNPVGTATSSAATLTVSQPTTSGGSGALPARLVNVSVRAQVGGAAGSPIVGFVLSGGTAGKRMVVRAIGPTLKAFGVADAVSDPLLQLWSSDPKALVAANDDWLPANADDFSRVGAFPLSAGSNDAALVATLAAGGYTTPVASADGSAGVVLVECYDGSSTDTSTKLVNASARAAVGTGDKVLIPAFAIDGEGSVRLLIRAAGPALLGYGVSDALVDPKITVYRGAAAVVSNDNWSDNANAAEIASVANTAGAFPFASGSTDSAVLVTLTAGSYTVVASGVGGTTGTALVEFYVVP